MRTIEEKFFDIISSQSFYDWYLNGGDFENHLQGELNSKSKEEILNQISERFSWQLRDKQ